MTVYVLKRGWLQRRLIDIFITRPERRFTSVDLVPLAYFGEKFTADHHITVLSALRVLTKASYLTRAQISRDQGTRARYGWLASAQLIAEAGKTDIVKIFETETRSAAAADVRDYACRFSADDTTGIFTGHAAIFDEVNNHNEIVRRGAFTRTLSDHQARSIRPPMLWSHRTDEPIGVWTDIREDATGLAVTGKLVTETVRGREAHALLKAGALTGLSIGFRGAKSARDASGARSLSDLDLVEISLVALPSAGNARVHSVRSLSGLAGFTEAMAACSNTFRKAQP